MLHLTSLNIYIILLKVNRTKWCRWLCTAETVKNNMQILYHRRPDICSATAENAVASKSANRSWDAIFFHSLPKQLIPECVRKLRFLIQFFGSSIWCVLVLILHPWIESLLSASFIISSYHIHAFIVAKLLFNLKFRPYVCIRSLFR